MKELKDEFTKGSNPVVVDNAAVVVVCFSNVNCCPSGYCVGEMNLHVM